MRRTNTITEFHKNAPRKLIRLYKRYDGNCYRLGKFLGVNASHIWQLLKHGHEPKREDLRIKLFLKVPRKPRQKTEPPEHVKKFRRLPKEERYKVMQQYIKWKESKQ